MKSSLLGTALLIGSSITAWAQPVTDGARVRAFRSGRTVVVGQVAAVADTVFVVESAVHGRVPIRFADLYRLDRSEGIHGHAARGAVIGAAGGLAFTIFFLSQFCDPYDSPCQGDEYVKAATIFTIPPALVGAAIGALVRTERWRRVDLSRVSVAVRPTARGMGVGLGVRF